MIRSAALAMHFSRLSTEPSLYLFIHPFSAPTTATEIFRLIRKYSETTPLFRKYYYPNRNSSGLNLSFSGFFLQRLIKNNILDLVYEKIFIKKTTRPYQP